MAAVTRPNTSFPADSFANALRTFSAAGKTYAFHDVRQAIGAARYDLLPYVTRVFAENLLRHVGRPGVSIELLAALADPDVAPDQVRTAVATCRASSFPTPRVSRFSWIWRRGVGLLPSMAAIPNASMRRCPIALMVDHSLQVDKAGSHDGRNSHNLGRELNATPSGINSSNGAQLTFDGLRVFRPGSGIIHQFTWSSCRGRTRR